MEKDSENLGGESNLLRGCDAFFFAKGRERGRARAFIDSCVYAQTRCRARCNVLRGLNIERIDVNEEVSLFLRSIRIDSSGGNLMLSVQSVFGLVIDLCRFIIWVSRKHSFCVVGNAFSVCLEF